MPTAIEFHRVHRGHSLSEARSAYRQTTEQQSQPALISLEIYMIFRNEKPASSRFELHPAYPNYFYANLDKLRNPYFQKVGVRTPIPQRAPPMDLPTFLAFGQKGFLSTKYLRVCLFCLVSIFSETPCLTMAKFCTQMYRPCANNLLGFMSKGVVVTKKRHF